MVEVITDEIRQQALQRQRELEQQRQQLQEQQRRASQSPSALALRQSGRQNIINRQLQSQSFQSQITGQQQKIESELSQVKQISSLPTVQEYQKEQQAQLNARIREAQTLANKPNIPLASISDKEIRDYVKKIRQGASVKDIKVTKTEEILKQSLPADIRNLSPEEVQSGQSNVAARFKFTSFTPQEKKVQFNTISVREQEFKPKDILNLEKVSVRQQQLRERAKEQLKSKQFSQRILGAGTAIAAGTTSVPIRTAQFGKSLIKALIPTIKESGKATLQLITNPRPALETLKKTAKEEPFYLAGAVIGELIGAKGTQTLFTKTPSISAQLIKLSPKYRPIVSTVEGDVIEVPSSIGGITQIKVVRGLGGKELELESLSKQASLAGKTVNAVSGQRDLFNLLKGKIDINKPIPKEDLLSDLTKSNLKKFREGTISADKFDELNSAIIQETGGKGLIETTFFADPRGRLRPSRLGLAQDEAKLIDILSGNISFKKAKPQAILFENVQIAKFPPALKGIEKKLKSGIPLTIKEEAKLLRFQLTPTGQFKPIGALTKEPEIILAKGEVIKRVATPAVTVINGQRVPIIRTIIVRDPKASLLLKKGILNKLTKEEFKEFRQRTGIDLSSLPKSSKPYVSPVGLSASLIPKKSKPISISKPFSKKVSSPITGKTSKLSQPSKLSKSGPSKISTIGKSTFTPSPPTSTSTSQPPSRRPPLSPPSKPPSKIIISPPFTPRKFPPGKLGGLSKESKRKVFAPTKEQGYNTFVRERKKFVKVSRKPLRKSEALDLGAYVTDRSLGATFKVKKAKGSAQRPLERFPSGYLRSNQKKFRPFQIRRGKKIGLTNTFIENKNRRLDTPTEVRKIQAAKFAKSLRYGGFKKIPRLIRRRGRR